jgi:hypothetical protein
MLHGLALQYLLFTAVFFSTLLHTTTTQPTMETQIFNAATTLLLAGAYILVGVCLFTAYDVITHHSSNMNPDIDYCTLQEELAELDPDIELADPALETRAAQEALLEARTAQQICERCAESPSLPQRAVRAAGRVAAAARAALATPATPEHDGHFYLEVYGLGVVIFVVYYSVDMVLLTPALSLLCGLMMLSIRDGLLVLRDQPETVEPLLVSRLVSFVATMLLGVAIIEMFFANSRELHDTAVDPASIRALFAYTLPLLACAVLGMLPRSSAHPRKLRRAAPVALLIAFFVVAWVLALDAVAWQRDYYLGSLQNIDSAWHDMLLTQAQKYTAGDSEPFFVSPYAQEDLYQYEFHAGPMPDPETYFAVPRQGHRSLPLLSVLVEPLLKLALTASVITAIVNHKAPETTAITAVLAAAKQFAFEPQPDVRVHLVRSSVIAGVAALLCMMRYVPLLHHYMARLPALVARPR